MNEVEAAALQSITPDKFLRHFRDIQEAKGEASEVNTGVARAKKAAKRDGVDLSVLSLIERLAGMTEGESDAFLRRLHMYATWLRMPLGAFAAGISPPPEPKANSQADFEAWSAQEAGKKSAVNGSKRDDNPHIAGSRNHVGWDKGWAIGFRTHQRRLAEGLKPSRMKADDKPTPKEIANAVADEVNEVITNGRGERIDDAAQVH